ncbi:MAG TPA: hypothetical protein VI357_10730 [Mycobacteriales bacterium]
MAVRWTPTKQDVRLAARTARLSAPFRARQGIRLAWGLILAVLVVLQLLGLHAWPAMGAPITHLVLSPVLQDRLAWLRPSVRQPAEADLTTAEVRLNRRHGYPWSAVRFAVETADQFVLVSAKEPTRFVAYLPKRAIEDPVAVRSFLAEQKEVRPG